MISFVVKTFGFCLSWLLNLFIDLSALIYILTTNYADSKHRRVNITDFLFLDFSTIERL